MKKDYPTKEISNKDIAEPPVQLFEFHYPDHGITIKAASQEEANVELNKLMNK